MKRLWDSRSPFLAYAVPYAYLGFWGHGGTDEVLANFLSIIGVITLMKWAYHRKDLGAMLLGNALSFLASCICLYVCGTEKWGQYFEPATAVAMLCAAALIALAVQLIWWCIKQRAESSY